MRETVSIMDFAPTLAHLLGVELPAGAGRPIPRLLGES
jgi:arylsulfatase A-like enzyme